MGNWDEHKSYQESEVGDVYVDRDELKKYLHDNFILYVYSDLKKILKRFTVIKYSNSFYTVDGGEGVSYYVLSGYNPIHKCGEAFVIEDSCY